MSGSDIVTVLGSLTSASDVAPRALLSASLPYYVGGPGVAEDSLVYDLFFNDYDEPYVVSAIAKVLGASSSEVQTEIVAWRDVMSEEDFVDTTTCWEKGVKAMWAC